MESIKPGSSLKPEHTDSFNEDTDLKLTPVPRKLYRDETDSVTYEPISLYQSEEKNKNIQETPNANDAVIYDMPINTGATKKIENKSPDDFSNLTDEQIQQVYKDLCKILEKRHGSNELAKLVPDHDATKENSQEDLKDNIPRRESASEPENEKGQDDLKQAYATPRHEHASGTQNENNQEVLKQAYATPRHEHANEPQRGYMQEDSKQENCTTPEGRCALKKVKPKPYPKKARKLSTERKEELSSGNYLPQEKQEHASRQPYTESHQDHVDSVIEKVPPDDVPPPLPPKKKNFKFNHDIKHPGKLIVMYVIIFFFTVLVLLSSSFG